MVRYGAVQFQEMFKVYNWLAWKGQPFESWHAAPSLD